ncbi:MAG TPA: hypothetical protein VN971_10155, partial [Thermoanaerobaculia bacterium]|nr:hypothetical protein [Thermoanaerobaculia bacterium]
MSWKKIFAVIRREYTERIRTKAFWIATLIIPFLFIGLFIVQIAVARRSGGERKLAVVDLTGRLYAPLAAELTHPQAEKRPTGQADPGNPEAGGQ